MDGESERSDQTFTQFFQFALPGGFELSSGDRLADVTLAYETWGQLNEARDNAVLVFHALTGSQHAAGHNAGIEGLGERWTEEMQAGWWDDFIGPGKAFDTNRMFVICANYVGGCFGSTGPTSLRPDGTRYGAEFPPITFADCVRSQVHLLDHLGIERLHAVVGPSTGGMACINFSTLFPERVDRVILIGTGLRATPLHRIHNFEQIRAIESDRAYRGGRYEPPGPYDGLVLARMISHKSFVSLRAMAERSRRQVVAQDVGEAWYGVSHPLESYMMHQGRKFAARFDANSYLRILDAWNRFDPLADAGVDDYEALFSGCAHQKYLIFSINTDVCYYPEEQREIASVLKSVGVEHTHITVHSDKGHDSFLLEPHLFGPHIRYLLDGGLLSR